MPQTGNPLQGACCGAALIPEHFTPPPSSRRIPGRRRALSHLRTFQKPFCSLITAISSLVPGRSSGYRSSGFHPRSPKTGVRPGVVLVGPGRFGFREGFLGGGGAGLRVARGLEQISLLSPALSAGKIPWLRVMGSVCAGGRERRIPKAGPEVSPPAATFHRLCPR